LLKSLSINNIVLIDKAEIAFTSGLCVLTGETGSGKSILLDALGLTIGFRSNLRLIGNDENRAQILAEFDISKNKICQGLLKEYEMLDVENPGQLRIRRIIQENSASRVFINDIACGVNLLAQIGETLVEIHGQHDQRGLLNPSTHLAILDEFADNEILLDELKKIYENLRITEAKISDLKSKKEQAQKEKDYLEHVVKELEDADLKPDEEVKLTSEKDQLIGKEKILKFLSELNNHITEASSQLIAAQRILLRSNNIIENFLPEKKEEFEKLNDKIDQQTGEIDSAISSFESFIKKISAAENNLEEIEERLFFIRSLARKFNTQIAELPNIILDAKEKLKLISNQEEITTNLETQHSTLLQQYQKIANELSKRRKESAKILSQKVEEELKFLKMEDVKFSIKLTANPLPLTTTTGLDHIRFTASTNKNPFDDISKIASGGELSRFMLALKVALTGIKSIPTMIFDEIDVGIGGSAADAVGRRLKMLSENLQILVVTHQPQIAAKAETHFKISKISADKKIRTVIHNLDSKNREIEIARMLSGETISYEAVAAAKSLIATS